MLFQACRTSLPMWAWLFLQALFWLPEVQANCTAPKPPPHSALKEEFPKEGYPVGTVLTYHCIPGYEYIPERNYSIKCLNTSKWSEIPQICQGKKCPIPNIEHSNPSTYPDDALRLGGNITISCLHGYRPVGETTLKCILKGGKVDWHRPLPLCDLIACIRPTSIASGHFDPNPNDEYYIGSVVTYRCQRDFSLIGNSTLTCITTEDGRNGKWNLTPPECKKVKCYRPNVENGKLVNLAKPSYTYNDVISFECNPGYSAVGSLHIKCGENSSWVPDIPNCVKEVKCDLPTVENGKLVNSSKPSYAYNDSITFECNSGYSAVGSLHIKCGENSLWVPGIPKCVKDIKCDLPKVENGKLVNSSKPSYAYNDAISFECNSGYFAVGSLHIKCGANSLWVPDVPKCVKGNVGNPNSTTEKPNTTTKDYAEYHKTTALGKLIILLAVLYNCW